MVDINFRNGYFYGICLICIIIFIFSTTSLVNAVIDFIYPPQHIKPHPLIEKNLHYHKEYPNLSDKEITKLVKKEKQEEKKREDYRRRRRFIIELTESLTFLVLVIPIYFFHWSKVEG
ncbi:hypothetical protein Halha_0814 [Halobacteroides halobius DSM 5150]|uniref:Uncharacterized protein n=1 Tax=Halobacteroides halobius (strain ATCC 35273 / DSM 5150 / MD-1) TaxID=748449 RepID=L0K8D7_HALHC|nr:hypothetical protein [Halobacteroides halobius]AGB40785.1 hypothetical protein Halha_0814 [Halobacteroides halobius DSM 5150]